MGTSFGSVATDKHNYLKHEEFELGEHPDVLKLKRYSSNASRDFLPNHWRQGPRGLSRSYSGKSKLFSGHIIPQPSQTANDNYIPGAYVTEMREGQERYPSPLPWAKS